MPLEICVSCHRDNPPTASEHCHACQAAICKDCLQENAAYTYPDNLPYCPAHQPENE